MKVIRIWFVALLLAAALREKPVVEIVWTYHCEYIYTPQHDSREDIPVVDPPKYVPIPVMEWRSLIDPVTGVWKGWNEPYVAPLQESDDTSIAEQ